MPEIRTDFISGTTVIVAPDRAKRPNAFVASPAANPGSSNSPCPFCEGNEDETPPEVLAVRKEGGAANGPGWSVRVVRNKFPAVEFAAFSEANGSEQAQGLREREPAAGVHEVVIESPRHAVSMAELSQQEIRQVLEAFRRRILDLKEKAAVGYILIFKNQGRAAGASLEHAHSQLLGLPSVPGQISRVLGQAKRYHEHHGRCIFCDSIASEQAAGERIVDENEHVIVLSNWAARFPYESRIYLKRHEAAFELSTANELENVAAVLLRLLRALERVAGEAPYNLMLHTAPPMEECRPYYHWHFELSPRLTGMAGAELATGWHMNPVAPEPAAAELRAAILKSD